MADKNTIWRELSESASRTVVDFDENVDTLTYRAEKWAGYEALSLQDKSDWFDALFSYSLEIGFSINPIGHFYWEKTHWFPTNKPNAHDALFREAFITWFLNEAVRCGYLQPDWTFPPEALPYLKHRYSKWDEENLVFTPINFEKIRALAKKDDELFPEPEPVRVEVAGAILNFTSWDAALVVYMDCSHKGEDILFTCQDEAITRFLLLQKRDKVQVLDRQSGLFVLCAAIFMRIPLVTDEHRNKEKVLKHVDGIVKSKAFEEHVTLFRGNVTEVDWRGRK